MDPGVEGRKLAIEIVATLVHIKSTMADLLLRPAGVPAEVYRAVFQRRDEATGRPLTKRQMAPLILEVLDQQNLTGSAVRALTEIASGWSSFHLADDECAARATVQKAREFLGTIELYEAREATQRKWQEKRSCRALSGSARTLCRGSRPCS